MTLFKSPILIVDTESTGLGPTARPIDLGALLLDVDGTEVAHYETLIRPHTWDEQAEEAAKIHRITWAMVKDAPKPAEVCADFRAWRESVGAVWSTSFNVGFDRPMLERVGVSLRWGPCIMVRAGEIMGPLGLLRDADPTHPRFDPSFPWLYPPLTPGRSLSACEGALLIVDAAQGVEAQTVANVHLAMKQNLEIIPVINKIDLPHANIPMAKQQLEDILAIPGDSAIQASAKEGMIANMRADAFESYLYADTAYHDQAESGGLINDLTTDLQRAADYTFGEIMLRFDPGFGRVRTARQFQVWEGGAHMWRIIPMDGKPHSKDPELTRSEEHTSELQSH